MSSIRPDPAVWETVTQPSGKVQYRCRVCQDRNTRDAHRLARHEESATHQEALQRRARSPSPPADLPPTSHSPNELPFGAFTEDATRALLESLAAPAAYEEIPAADWPEPSNAHTPPRQLLDWGLGEPTELQPSLEARAAGEIAKQLLEFQQMDAPSDDELQERSDEEDEEAQDPTVTVDNGDEEDWFPWTDRITCTLDILMHLPRSVFSHRQLELFLWLLKVNNVEDVPTVKSMQELNVMLQQICGIETIEYNGALGHRYHVNNLSQIISQEMSNPRVRPHLEFYPEDTAKLLQEARQGKRWLEEIPFSQTTPMARIDLQDYYIHEPAMLKDGTYCIPIRWFIRDKVLVAKCWDLCVVTADTGESWRVVKREREVAQGQFLKNWTELQVDYHLYGVPSPTQIKDIQDPVSGALVPWDLTDPALGNTWRAKANGGRVLAFPIWLYCDDTSGNLGASRAEAQKEYNVHFLSTSNIAPPLEMLDGVVDQLETAQKEGIWAWDVQEKELVLLIPSVLALLGDNPMQSEFACHIGLQGKFFCRACWVKGSDSMEDDNGKPSAGRDRDRSGGSDLGTPDGSDAESRAGSDVAEPDAATLEEEHRAEEADADSASAPRGPQPPSTETGTSPDNVASDPNPPGTDTSTLDKTTPGPIPPSTQPPSVDAENQPKKRGKAKETLEQAMLRVKAFVKIGKLRTKEETTTKLRTFFQEATTLFTQTKVKNMRTASGIKDTFQLVFLEKLFDSYKKKRGVPARQAALDEAIQQLPAEITSPVWRLHGLDPHCDTPVEILHVVLLGFVKYMWRDLVQNQLFKKDELKKLLETRLNSVDVTGLGISPLAGHTLVQYAGSLVGRDFRAIAQVAPFVLYDLVSKDCLETWVALSKLVPLIWQPSIKDIDAHSVRAPSFVSLSLTILQALLAAEINHFLACAAHWTTRWFNKPKFHILLHLPDHIRRFGPASLFATEAFESFNAIIRAKSVHSNRHAPSRDIARAFAQGNRIRHLLSGGHFMRPSLILANPPSAPAAPGNPAASVGPVAAAASASGARAPPLTAKSPRLRLTANRVLSKNQNDWVQAGVGPMSLVSSPNTVTQYLGLGEKKKGSHGICISDHKPARPFTSTLTGVKLPQSLPSHTARPILLKTNSEMYLDNGDHCPLDTFVIAKQTNSSTFVGRVKEILQIEGSPEDLSCRASAVLVQFTNVGDDGDALYGMPPLDLQDFATREYSRILLTNTRIFAINIRANANISFQSLTNIHIREYVFVLHSSATLDEVNVQHNCAAHNCADTGTRQVYQERVKTTHTQPWIAHSGLPTDLLLNTGQMRDAVHLQQYRIDSPVLDEETMDSIIDLSLDEEEGHGRGEEVEDVAVVRAPVQTRWGMTKDCQGQQKAKDAESQEEGARGGRADGDGGVEKEWCCLLRRGWPSCVGKGCRRNSECWVLNPIYHHHISMDIEDDTDPQKTSHILHAKRIRIDDERTWLSPWDLSRAPGMQQVDAGWTLVGVGGQMHRRLVLRWFVHELGQ
ncbi:hypothetical protein FB45DRAFT_1085359 [Roridomyces roridus]|uniref:Uncharacterized protein n=1 Tax=Roridomyces roridus TaxID=1738132 RepID=A0AAD7F8D2_9AGAR|nr:hypothetical protein FB45DRAFT_1085359 [Roridomyces roridus]